MAEVQQQDQGGDKKHKKIRAKKASTHIDMTPMVDLAFLLLTFFMLTTTFSRPKTMEINMPVKDAPKEEQQKVAASQTLSVLLTEKDHIIWYMGVDDPTQPPQTNSANFSLTSANSIHKVLLEKNQKIYDAVKEIRAQGEKEGWVTDTIKARVARAKADKKGLIVLIKCDDKARYKNLVDILDEMSVCAVGRFAIVDITPSEQELIKNTSIQ
jgi:biopolymer transport protein ExbD